MECEKGDFPIQHPISGVNFSNMSIPWARINMSETEHDSTFESPYLLTSRIDLIPSCLKPFRLIVFRLQESAFVKLNFPLNNAIISLTYRTTPISLLKKVCPQLKLFFGETSSHTLGEEILSIF